jgi:hypothetical protein
MEVDLRHEGTHALLHATLPVVPLWLDEGLAEYFEVPASERTSHYSHLSKTRWSVRLGNVATIEQLEQLRDLTEMGQTEYRQAWAWVHFLLHGSAAAHDELMRYLNDIQNHMPPGVLSQRIRNRLPDVEERFARHFLSWRR